MPGHGAKFRFQSSAFTRTSNRFAARRNDRLYRREGLLRIKAALRPGGCLGVWSAGGDERFKRTLGEAGFSVEVIWSRAHTTSGSLHALFIGRLPASGV